MNGGTTPSGAGFTAEDLQGRILSACPAVSSSGSAAGAQEPAAEPDAWLNADLRRELRAGARPWRQALEERDLRGSRDLLGDEAGMNDVLADDLVSAAARIVRDPRKVLDFRVRTLPPPPPHPYAEPFRELHEEFSRRAPRD